MPDFRRQYQPGATYFFPIVTAGRWLLFGNPAARTLLGRILREVAAKEPFQTDAIVLLPDHLHCSWSLPAGDDDFSTRWKRTKIYFTRHWLKTGGVKSFVTEAQRQRHTRGIWQRHFWEHRIRDERDYESQLDDTHYNPVKHGYVSRLEDWPTSSFLRHQPSGYEGEGWGRDLPRSLVGVERG